MLRLHAARLTVVLLVAPAIAAATIVEASASTWLTRLNSASLGKAQSSSTPAAPVGVTASCVSSSQALVKVTWGSVVHAKYTVSQSSTSSTSGFTQVATALTSTSWTSPSLTSGRTYWFQVSASIGTNWKSANSSATAGRVIRSSSPICS